MSKNRDANLYSLANEWTVETIYKLAIHFNTSIDIVLQVFDKSGYWKIINDDRVCSVSAHYGINDIIKTLEGDFNEILSRNR